MMETKVRELPGLEFGPEQVATFAPLASVIEAFAEEQGLGVERTFDRDPLDTFSAYFLTWQPERCKGCFIQVSASNPLAVETEFQIAAFGSLQRHRKWTYSSTEGQDRFITILWEAKQFLESGPNAAP